MGYADPRAFGKGLTVNSLDEWRYRVGSYRILALIHEGIITIEVFSIGRRSTIYNR
ncbi:type II toxin-antitoxin system RelE family toxin [Actinobaculum suis]|uniref:type II toxin-antitoxin system RelE family toxin n=1 Tax=Actinobaculum suis TaxID=1657 RepID=UPI00389AEC49